MSQAMKDFSLRRVNAMVLRYLYLVRRSWPRVLELMYWPAVQLILWGFITQFFLTNSSWLAQASGVLMAAVLLWDVLFRGQLVCRLRSLRNSIHATWGICLSVLCDPTNC